MNLPTFAIKGLELSRLLVGGNPISGFSHAEPARTTAMLDYFTTENAKQLLRRCEERGITGATLRADNHIIRLLREYWNEGGTIKWLAQTAPEEDHVTNISKAAQFGASAIYIHGGQVDSRFEAGEREEVHRLLQHAKDTGLPAGCASHVPANLLEIERRGWEPDFYMVCLHNLTGYRGELGADKDEMFDPADRAIALDAIARLPRPCIAYKILGAGRYEPERCFKEVLARIKPIDAVVVGMYPPDGKGRDIVAENVQYVVQYGQ